MVYSYFVNASRLEAFFFILTIEHTEAFHGGKGVFSPGLFEVLQPHFTLCMPRCALWLRLNKTHL